MKLADQSRVAVVGGGPAGALAAYFLLELSDRVGLRLQVDLYEPRDFSRFGPAGCNMCAGVVSESLVQTLAAEGINLPPEVVQRGIDSYVLHTTDLPPVAIATPVDELRIATVYRGGGPRAPEGEQKWVSFDGHLLEMARERGARILPYRVTELALDADGRPLVGCSQQGIERYDLLIGAIGVNSGATRLFEELGIAFQPPPVKRGFVSEIYLGVETVQKYLGNSMHIFLLDIPKLKFAAVIPKVEYATVCLLGDEIDKELAERFMRDPATRSCFPPDLNWSIGEKVRCGMGQACQCGPRLNMGAALNPYGDRVVLVGDVAISRLYKDGIGAAYMTAKAGVVTALFYGVSANDFRRRYAPVVRGIARDNRVGTLIFLITLLYQKWLFLRRGMVRMVRSEAAMRGERRDMSRVLWDTFTGSATYVEIFLRTLHPRFIGRLFVSTLSPGSQTNGED
ncbi:MAG: hypothetical protein G8237_09815 [Magnetococcales bacterium]|nr:hypothetical protein [Magnetococcales bacterium]NGZ06640.1 hypothetical protein [Magnetococcales bacterium]